MRDEIFHQTSWALTAQGTPLDLYKKVHTKSTRPFLFIGGVHGDEPEGVRLAQDLLAWLLASEDDLHPWILIPCLNPDGFQKNQRTNANNVDLNRNFPSADWSSLTKAPRYFPGLKPGSEKEVQALVKLIEDEKPQLIIHFHSWEPCVVYTGSPGKKAAQILGEGTGYEVREDIGYPTPGSLGQYGWLEHQTPVICIEAQADSSLENVWPLFGQGLQKLLRQNQNPMTGGR